MPETIPASDVPALLHAGMTVQVHGICREPLQTMTAGQAAPDRFATARLPRTLPSVAIPVT
jgi:hypothetical protein